MTDPERLSYADPKGRHPAAVQARIDELLARIEDEDLISAWCWSPLTDTVSRLTDLGEDLRWVVAAYLSAVVVRGDAMYRNANTNAPLPGMAPETTRPTTDCPCGQEIETPRPQRRRGRDISIARCPSCHIDLVTYDGVPYERPTLIAAGF